MSVESIGDGAGAGSELRAGAPRGDTTGTRASMESIDTQDTQATLVRSGGIDARMRMSVETVGTPQDRTGASCSNGTIRPRHYYPFPPPPHPPNS